ncbi:MAG: VWA domain-containing protein [Spirochaetia bacterium]|jgi:Mg-chelatase subunit ChlD|nr:VWA domain-containing protein [Spirochaetia bacterium]
MKNRKLLTLIAFGMLIFPGFIWSQNITITQIDSAELLPFSRIDCYLSISNDQGEVVNDADPAYISIKHETSEGMQDATILDVQRNDSANGTITFLLILDNSGSMYEAVGDGAEGHRMNHAVRAVEEFLNRMDNPDARVGLAVFNTRYTLLSEPVKDFRIIQEALKNISEPDNEEAYTELFYSINMAALDMAPYRGRKAIILLSDGENYPYFSMSGKSHPDIGDILYHPENALDSLKRESVTLYGINFSPDKDQSLSSISIGSGGKIYDALTDSQLSSIYNKIRDRIESEYKITVRAPLGFLGSPDILAKYNNITDTRTYHSSSLMGLPGNSNLLLLLLILLGSFILWFVLLIIRFEKPASTAELSMLPYGRGKPIQRTIPLTSNRTVIGGSAQADFTIAGIPNLKESHATIVQNEKEGTYTVVSDEDILVNNQITKKRKLKPGDVINVEGATIVFDAPEG